ncbi:hypothetical protein N7G274_002318 [Stereocaulon virgatum]|uniref:Kelch repeat-containing protein n=1 Tax=Stereocaulon virgatum TaxID=373712 RepID=A0ABR4AIG7_9LECA
MARAKGTSDDIKWDTDASDESTRIGGGAWSSCPIPLHLQVSMRFPRCAVTVTSGEQDGITIWLIGSEGELLELRNTSNITLKPPGQRNWSVTEIQTRNAPERFVDFLPSGALVDDEVMLLERRPRGVLWSLNLTTRSWRKIPYEGVLIPWVPPTLSLVNGRLYCFGVFQDSEEFVYAMDIERLNEDNSAQSGRWHEAIQHGRRPPPRWGHTAVFERNVIYIFGGYNRQIYFHDVWAYDAGCGTWTEILTTGKKPKARQGHAAALVNLFTIIEYPDIGTLN